MARVKNKLIISLLAVTMAFSLTACAKQTDIDNAVTPLSSQITTINNTLTEMQTLDTTLDGYIDTLESEVQTLETQLSTVNTTLETLNGDIDGVIETLTQTKTALESEIASIKTEITALKAKDTELNTAITNLQTALSTEITDTKTWANETFATLTACETLKTEINASIATLQGKVNGLEMGVETLNTTVIALQEQITQNAEKIAEIEKQLACLNNGGHDLAESWTNNGNGMHSKSCANCSYVLTQTCEFSWVKGGDNVFTASCSTCSATHKITVTLGEYEKIYSGTAKEPSVTLVFDEEKTLEKDTDYELTYSNNIYVGTAKITIKLIGELSGELTVNFDIIQDPATGDFDGEWVTF